MNYTYIEHDKAKKFLKKHKRDVNLLLRINKKYMEILKNPFKSEFSELKSSKCPKCQRARVGDYRIVFYVSRNKNIVEIIDIIHRNDEYQMY